MVTRTNRHDSFLDRHSTVGGLVAAGAGLFLPGQPLGLARSGRRRRRAAGQNAADKPLAVSQPRLTAVALVLLLPAVWFASWPYRAAPLLIVLGLALQLLPIRKRWADWLAGGAVTAGVVLLVQALALELYAAHTAWSHELPWPLPDLLAGVATLLGIDATADGSNVVMHSMRQVHRLGATWELLLDPATLLFFVGGLTMLARGAGRSRMTNDRSRTRCLRSQRDAIHSASLVILQVGEPGSPAFER